MYLEIRKTRNWFRYETFIYLFEFKVFRHEERERESEREGERERKRETQLLSLLTIPSDLATCGTPPQTTGLALASSENRLPSSSIESQLFFQIPKSSAHRFRAWRHSRPRLHFLSGVFIVTSVIVTSTPTRVNTCTQCVHLTNPCTKLKGSQPN